MKLLEVAATEIAREACERVNGGLSNDIISKEFCLIAMEKLEQKAPGFNISEYVKAISKAISEKIINHLSLITSHQ